MRNLFDTKKEHKSLKLVKKLQEQADLEWEKEVRRRKEQELNDEAIAKELQAQLEDEQRQLSSSNSPFSNTQSTATTRTSSSNSPPPLPTKPREYNSSSSFGSSAANSDSNRSNNSLPTAQSSSSLLSPAIKPLYGLPSSSSHPTLPPRQPNMTPSSSNNNKKPVKSYLPAQTYKPELHFALASPTPSPSSVFHQNTPALTPAVKPLAALAVPPQIKHNNSSNSSVPTSSSNSNTNGSQFFKNKNTASTPAVQPTRPSSVPAVTTVEPQVPKMINHMSMPEPVDMTPSYTLAQASAPSSFGCQTTTPRPPIASNISSYNNEPIVLPLQQPQQQQNYDNNQPQNNESTPQYGTPAATIPVVKPYPNYQQVQQNNNNNNAYTNYQQQTPANNANTNAPYPNNYQHQQQQPRRESAPISLPLGANDIVQNASYPQQQQSNYNNTPPAQQSYSSNSQSQQSSYGTPQPPTSYNTPVPAPVYSTSPPTMQQFSTSPPSIQQHSAPVIPTTKNFQLPPPPPPAFIHTTSMPLNKQQQQLPKISSSTNPYFKKQGQQKPLFSDSVLSLKPDEEQHHEHEEEEDDWDNAPVKKRVHTPPPAAVTTVSDNESDYDYSDMIYDRRNEEEGQQHTVLVEESDPFADSFAVEVPKPSMVKTLEPTIQILDPTMLSRKLSTKIAVEEKKEEAVKKIKEEKVVDIPKEEKIADEPKEEKEESVIHQYVEKESEEIEAPQFTGFQTPIQQHHMRTQSMGTFLAPVMENTPRPVYQQSSPAFFKQPDEMSEDGSVKEKVFPTNILRAGAPSQMSANNPYAKKQSAVPASDYGYFKENEKVKNKSLPELPKTTSEEDRHITVASVNPEQRVWIRIHPTDTGKMLAERIHIVASYQTRKVTKITTKNGRNIPLDNSPLFDDWNEIFNFQEGEAWTVEWVPIEPPYVDIIMEGNEFMKQLKAKFRGSSSNHS